jgi:hypothetical protein
MVGRFLPAAIAANDDNRANSAKVIKYHAQPRKMAKNAASHQS